MNILQVSSSFSNRGYAFFMEVEAEGYPDGVARVRIDESTYNDLVALFKSEPIKVERVDVTVPVADGKKEDILGRLLQQGREEMQREIAKKEAERQISPFEKVGFSRHGEEVVQFSSYMVDNSDQEEEDPGEQYHEAGTSEMETEQY